MVVSIKAPILENNKILPDFYLMKVAAPEMVAQARPGQFVMVRISSTLDPFLKRPISLHRIDKKAKTIELLYQVVGRGTEFLSQIREGDLEILGPLGNGFTWEQGFSRVVIVGGGCGIAPLLALAEELVGEGKEVDVLLGAQTKEKLLSKDDFEALGCKVQVATDDGSAGRKGFVTELLENLLLESQEKEGNQGNKVNKVSQVYCCGPLLMTKGIIKLTQAQNIPTQVSLEERMACGVGACLGCVCQVKGPGGTIISKRICHDGPVFYADELIFPER